MPFAWLWWDQKSCPEPNSCWNLLLIDQNYEINNNNNSIVFSYVCFCVRLCAQSLKYRCSREHYIPLELKLQMPVRHPLCVGMALLATEKSLSVSPILLYIAYWIPCHSSRCQSHTDGKQWSTAKHWSEMFSSSQPWGLSWKVSSGVFKRDAYVHHQLLIPSI